MKSLNLYDIAALVLISVLIVVMLSRADIYPVFVDIYYHMSAALSFDKAGGIVLWDFWEFAPEGRPHLYPPLLHCIMLFLSEFSSNIVVGKFISFIMFPASQVSLWIFAREIFSRKTGFYSVLMLSSSVEYFRLQTITSAAALVLVLMPLVFYAFEKRKYTASVVLLASCLYTHIGMGPVALSAFILTYAVRRERLRKAAKVVVASLLLYMPWGIHVLMNMESLSASNPSSGGAILLFCWILGIMGILICAKRRKEFLIPVCIFVCMIPIAFTYMGRFTGHIILPLALLSGITLSSIDERLSGDLRAAFIIGALIVLSLIAPTLTLVGAPQKDIQPRDREQIVQRDRVFPQDVPPQRMPQQGRLQKEPYERPQRSVFYKAESLLRALSNMRSDSYLTADNLKMAEIIRENSQENEIVFASRGMMGCFITATTGRPQTLGMWQEVASDFQPDPRAASLFLVPAGAQVPQQLKKVGETTQWEVYRAPQERKVTIPEALIRKEVVYILMIAALIGTMYDFLRSTG